MRKLHIILSFILFSVTVFCQKAELIESIPAETNLDNPDIRNTQEVWLELFKIAKERIDIEQFYISNEKGKMLEPVIASLENAAGRGVNIRIIADSKFYKTYPETLDRLEQKENIEVRIIDFEKIAGGVQHSKYFIVDGKKLFLGSQNFDWRALEHIHEIGILINDENFTGAYEAVFELDWELAGGGDKNELMERYKLVRFKNPAFMELTDIGLLIMMPVFSPTGLLPMESLWDKNILLEGIDSVKNELLLQFLSYRSQSRDSSYWGEMDSALICAADRGVKVRLIISDWSLGKNSIETLKKLNEHENIEVKFTAIPEWSGGYIPFARVEQCKYMVFDNKACWIGTGNMEKSYFYSSRNVGVIVTNEKLVDRLGKIFYKSWNSDYANEIESEKQYEVRFHEEAR